MSKFVIRSDFGGPSVSNEYREELTNIIKQMADVPLAYTIDVMLYVGGDFLEITDPTGLYSPRVSVPKKTAVCVIQMNAEEVLNAKDPRGFLRETFHKALSEMIERIAAKDKSVDAGIERNRIAILKFNRPSATQSGGL